MPISSASSGLSGAKLASATTVAAAIATGGTTGNRAESASRVPRRGAPAIAWPSTSPPAASARPSAITDHSGTSGKCWNATAIATQKGDHSPASPMPLRAITATRTRSGSGGVAVVDRGEDRVRADHQHRAHHIGAEQRRREPLTRCQQRHQIARARGLRAPLRRAAQNHQGDEEGGEGRRVADPGP